MIIVKKFWWVIAIVLLYIVLAVFGLLPSSFNFLVKEKLKMRDTPVAIEQIKKIGQLITAEYYGEVYADLDEVYTELTKQIADSSDEAKKRMYEKYSGLKNFKPNGKAALVYIGRGVVKAGLNFSSISEKNLKLPQTESDSLVVTVERPQIIESIINPWYIEDQVFGYDVFRGGETASFKDEDVKMVKILCKKKLAEDAIRQGIMERSEKSAKESLKQFFRFIGFPKVHIKFAN